jgi:hypothetical protein
MRPILKDSTDQSTLVRVVDTSGLPLETVDAQSPLPTFWYRRHGAVKVNFQTVDLASASAAHSDGGIEHIDDGMYRVDVPDAAFATGAADVTICGTVTGGVVIPAYHQLVDFDLGGTEAVNLRRGSQALVLSTVSSGPTNTIIPTNLTETTNDHYNGRTLTFTSGALDGESTAITDYDGASKDLVVTALTEAPAQGDKFVIS